MDGLSRKGFGASARAMMTSDAFPKWAHRSVDLGDGECIVAGMAKGAGMIHPDMATMLAVIVTDADLTSEACERILHESLADATERAATSLCALALARSITSAGTGSILAIPN